jgi:hypothetical protein
MFETVAIQCGKGFVVHEAHSWHHGFLNLKKTSCEGLSQKAYDILMKMVNNQTKKKHKHRFEYKPSQIHLWVNPERYVWICKDQMCNVVISTPKEEMNWALLHKGRSVAKPTVIYREPWQSS